MFEPFPPAFSHRGQTDEDTDETTADDRGLSWLFAVGSSSGVRLKDTFKAVLETNTTVGASCGLEHGMRFPPPQGDDWLVGMAKRCRAAAAQLLGDARKQLDDEDSLLRVRLQQEGFRTVSSDLMNKFLINAHQQLSSLPLK